MKKVKIKEGPGLGHIPRDLGIGTKEDEFFTMRSILMIKNDDVLIVTGCDSEQKTERKEDGLSVVQIPWKSGSSNEKMEALTTAAKSWGADEERRRVISFVARDFDTIGNIVFIKGTDSVDIIRETILAGIKLARKLGDGPSFEWFED